MRLDETDLARGHPGRRQRVPDDTLLRGSVRSGDAVGRAVLVDRGAADDGEHRVTMPTRVGEPLEEQHPRTLTEAESVGGRPERALPAELGEPTGGGEDGDTAGERGDALPVSQRLHGEMQGHQGGRAGGVDRQRRPAQSQRVGDPPGHHPAGAAGDDIPLGGLGRFGEHGAVVLGVRPREHPRLAVAEGTRVDSRVLHRLPGGLKEQPLLRVHGRRLAR